MISAIIEKYLFPRTFRISLTYAIFIIFGLALGPWKGAFLGLLSDTLNQVIFGISTWMIEYAIVPVLISFLAGWLINIVYLKSKKFWALIFTFLVLLTFFLTYFLLKNGNTLRWNEFSRKSKKFIPLNIVALISVITLSLTWILTFSTFGVNLISKKFKVKWSTQLILSIFITTTLILIICRWLWGPFTYINYHNRFRSGTWKYKDYYLVFMIPIIFKSLVEIPVYTSIIYFLYPIIFLLRKKIHSKKKQLFIN